MKTTKESFRMASVRRWCYHLPAALAFGLTTVVKAQDIFVVTGSPLEFPQKSAIGEYGLDGSTVNASLIPVYGNGWGIAVSGNNLFVENGFTLGEYTTSGVSEAQIANLDTASGIAISGNDLFVGIQATNGSVSEYGLDGSIINGSLISSLNQPYGIAISGDDLFVANRGSGTIGEYTTSGAVVNARLITGLNGPIGLAISGNDLFVVNGTTVGEYTTAGATVNATLVTGPNSLNGIAIFGNDLFVSDTGDGTIGEYTLSGSTVNASVITGLDNPTGIAISPAPEPPAIAFAGLGAAALVLWRSAGSTISIRSRRALSLS